MPAYSIGKLRRCVAVLVCALTLLSVVRPVCAQDREMSLAGTWGFIKGGPELSVHQGPFPELKFADSIELPGTTDTNHKGAPSSDRSTYSLTQPWGFVGTCWYERDISIPQAWAGKRVCLLFERTKYTQVWLDGHPLGDNVICCSPQNYELSESILPGSHRLTVAVDNRRLPPSGADAHQFSGNTQGNWNGIIGQIELSMNDPERIDDVQIYPDAGSRRITVKLRLSNTSFQTDEVQLKLHDAGEGVSADSDRSVSVHLPHGSTDLQTELTLGPNAALWDEFHPVIHHLTVRLEGHGSADEKTVSFGLRSFTAAGRQFAINGHHVFLRGRHDACVFPLTGHPPMDVEGWLSYLRICQSYGLNHIRFHTWTPPEAAFEAADQLGFYLQPELPFWGAFTRDVEAKLLPEAESILHTYGNHPSFVMFSMGNEHWDGRDVLADLVDHLRSLDPRHLYVRGSNAFYYLGHPDKSDDYLIGAGVKSDDKGPLRSIRGSNGGNPAEQGHVQTGPPDTLCDYTEAIKGTTWPSVTHEMGQYTAFPHFNQIEKYSGVSRAYNIEKIQANLSKSGMSDQAEDFARASGALAGLCYREEIESCLRTPNFGGFELLDLQDYPGQGIALVGMLDSLMHSKGIYSPEQWRQFCAPVVILAKYSKYTWTTNETFTPSVDLANYGDRDLHNQEIVWTIEGKAGNAIASGMLPSVDASAGALMHVGAISVPLLKVLSPCQLTIRLSLKSPAVATSYRFWVYPTVVQQPATSDVKLVTAYDSTTEKMLALGKRVLLICDSNQSLISSVGGGFASDFWNFTFFHNKPGTMGLLCDPATPALSSFPTEDHSNWQWFHLTMKSQPLVLDSLFPKGERPTVQVIDNYERCHKLGMIFEVKSGAGKLLVCTSDLLLLAKDHPEARQLLASLQSYVESDQFDPRVPASEAQLRDLFRTSISMEGCKATASSYDHGWQGYSPSQLIDGNDARVWKADPKASGATWFQIEFKNPTDLNGGEILWAESKAGYKYTIDTSAEGSRWHSGCDRKDHPSETDLQQFPLRVSKVKFVKVSIFATPENQPAEVSEIRFYPATSEQQQLGMQPHNPILPDYQADPSARVFNGKLYIYPSHDIAGSTGWNMVDWHAFSTDDMRTFTDHGVIFSLKDITWADKFAWAPDCIERNGKYFFYYPADFQIGVAVGDSPTGPFKDPLGKPLIHRDEVKGVASIDPCVFIEDDGQAYLYFGNSNNHVAIAKLKADMVTLDGALQVLNLPHYHEGIWVHKRDQIYYFSYPSCRGDKIANLMEYSIAKGPVGPFEYKGVILDNRSRNVHGSITEFNDQWYLFYHVAGPSAYERQVCAELLDYNKDGSIKPMQMTRK